MKKIKSVLITVCAFVLVILFNYLGIDINSVSKESVDSKNEVNVKVEGDLKVHFLDVGQADSILIENKDKYMLIDAGNNADSDLLIDYFNELGINEFEYVIATHAHEDHIGGMDEIVDSFKINNFIMPDVVTTTRTFENLLDALERKNLLYESPEIGTKFDFSDSYFKIMSIDNESKDLNDSSVCIKLYYGNNSFLFMGDASSKVENNILKSDLKSDVLKAGHHGSRYSSSSSFLEKVKPTYTILSCGVDNKYMHPHQEAIDRINKVNSKILRTDIDGTIVIESDGNNLKVIKEDISLDG